MENHVSKPKMLCSICSRQADTETGTVFCKGCPLKLHLQCLLDLFPQISTEINANKSETVWEWLCFRCRSDRQSDEPYRCMFCDEARGFMVRIELAPAEFNETAKMHWGHLKCIEQRNSCNKRLETCSFYYTNTINHIRRAFCKKCKKPLNIECKECQKFFAHFPCPYNKMRLSEEEEDYYCSKCVIFFKRKKSAALNAKESLNEKLRKPKEEKKVNSPEPPEQRPAKREVLKIHQEETLHCDSPLKSDSLTSPLDAKEVIEDNIEEQEILKKKRIVSTTSTTGASYKTKAPDILIELLNQLIRFDRLEILREKPTNTNFESSETFLKFQEKLEKQEIHYNFEPESFLSYNDPSQKYLIFNSSTYEFELVNKPPPLKKSKKCTDIDFIHQRATKNMYFYFKDFEKDLFKVFSTLMLTRCSSPASKSYMTTIFEQYLKIVKSKKIPSNFLSTKAHDMENIVYQECQYKLPCSNWPVIPKSFRHYQYIESYVPIDPKQDVLKDIKAYKTTVKCPENCGCWSFETLGDFSYELSSWVSTCPNRSQKIECDENSHEGVCKNMAIRLKNRKLLGNDVEERLSWGIDIYTRKNIFMVLPECKEEIETKYDFIQNKLIRAINFQHENGWDMKHACEFIIEKTRKGCPESMFDEKDREYAKILLKALNMNQEKEAFRVHSKGQGLICINKAGFKKNEFIVEYFGELYSPCYWYEKQDQIKKYLKEKNKKNVLLDFYNIMLEIHKNDPKGYNIFFVDPIHKGNYSSRLSHSCDPNCGTVTTIVNGQYVIGMYAMKDISFGEELTFDYCSVTEDPNELKKAFCLCGSKKCRGKYLELIKTKESNTFIEQVHSFLERNKIILRASLDPLTAEDQEILDRFHLKDRILDQTPDWLKKWLALTLQFVEKEKEHTRKSLDEKIKPGLTPEEEKKAKDMNEYWAGSQKESRIQNLVITCDKVKYFLKKSKRYETPFKVLSADEVYDLLWGKPEKMPIPNEAKETTVINDVLKTLYQYIEIPEAVKCIHLVHLIDYDIQKLHDADISCALSLIRFAFLMLSMVLKDLRTDSVTSENGLNKNAMADTCYFYAFTHTYFKSGEYLQTHGDAVIVRKCDVSNVETYIQEAHNLGTDGEIVSKGVKNYKGTMLWGQLVGWFKQTVANPEASLSQDRRGTLSNPLFSGSFLNAGMEYPFQKKSEMKVLAARSDFLNHLKKKPSYSWPPLSAKWSYKNPQKVYGTLLFESQLLSERFPNYLTVVLDHIDSEPAEQIRFLEEIEDFLEGLKNINLKNYYEKYVGELKDFKTTDLTLFTQKYSSEKRKRNTTTLSFKKFLKEGENDSESGSPKLKKKKKVVKNKNVKIEESEEAGQIKMEDEVQEAHNGEVSNNKKVGKMNSETIEVKKEA